MDPNDSPGSLTLMAPVPPLTLPAMETLMAPMPKLTISIATSDNAFESSSEEDASDDSPCDDSPFAANLVQSVVHRCLTTADDYPDARMAFICSQLERNLTCGFNRPLQIR